MDLTPLRCRRHPSYRWVASLAPVLSILVLDGCGAGDEAPVAETGTDDQDFSATAGPAGGALGAVHERGALRVCTTGDYRPYTYLDPQTQEWSGIDLTMADALAEHLGVQRELVPTTWDELVLAVEAGECDIAMGGVSLTPERDAVVDFSPATVQDGKTPIARCEDAERYQTIEDIDTAAVRVITPVGGTNETFAEENFPEAQLIRWEDNNTIFDQILAGDADVMVTDASETRWVAHENPGELCAIHPDDPFTTFENGYLLPEGDGPWRDAVSSWLTDAQADGTYAEAEEPWFG